MNKLHALIKEYGALFLPDIGTFFNQDLKKAYEVIDVIASSGIPIIKGEILHDSNVCLNIDFYENYYDINKKKIIHENYRQLIDRKTISLEKYSDIFKHAQNKGCELILSVYDETGVDFSVDHGVLALKVASSNITHLPLLKYMSRINSTIILDTGHSTIEEIARAINILNDNGKNDIIIEHSPLAPPNPIELHNLMFMKTLGKIFGLPYGLSDHHNGEEMIYAAAALGAVIIEKGVYPNGLTNEQDLAHAMNITDITNIQTKISNIHKAIGSGVRYLDRNREKYRSRMCLFAKENIRKGEVITSDVIGYAFPLTGIGVEYLEETIGRIAKKNIIKGAPINWTDL
jgi:sialic acid synthase SpsE